MKTLKKMIPICLLALALVISITLLVPKAEAALESDLYFDLNSDGNGYTVSDCNTSASGELVIPATYNGKPVTAIGYEAFYCSRLTSVTIPDSVTTIGDSAFSNCSSLTSITIPDSVTTIGESAFLCCSRLTSITIPDSVTSVGKGAFTLCSDLTEIWVDANNHNYSSDNKGVLFNKDQTRLIQAPGEISGHYTVPDSVTTIGDAAFYYCKNLTSVTIPDSVTTIGNSAFCECFGLTSVTIPDSVTTIGDAAFRDCSSLTNITIPDSVTTIGDYAFYGCSSLTSVTIPDSVTAIGYSAFYECSSLTSVTIGDSVTTIGDYAFYYCKNLTSVTIPDSVTAIGYRAFSSCSSLTNITIPDSVTTIGDAAFRDCSSLTSVTIPDSVITIGDYAFYYCNRLKNVYYAGTQNQWNSISIGTDNQYLTNATIHYNHIHDYTVIPPVTVDATCTEEGYIEYTCMYGETYRETIPALGHDYTGPEKTVAVTCTENGYSGASCTRCDSVRQDQIVEALGHNAVVIAVKDPTCTEQGVSKVGTMCERCEEVFIQPTYTPALGHDYVDGVCSRCQETDPDQQPQTVPGDMTGDTSVNNDDVVLLLWHTLFPEEYPLGVSGDINKDGSVNNDDVVLLLWHTLFPEDYPL